MPNADGGPDAPSGGDSCRRIKPALVRAEGEYSFLKGLTVTERIRDLDRRLFSEPVGLREQSGRAGSGRPDSGDANIRRSIEALAAPLSLQKQLIADYHNAIVAGTDAEATATRRPCA